MQSMHRQAYRAGASADIQNDVLLLLTAFSNVADEQEKGRYGERGIS